MTMVTFGWPIKYDDGVSPLHRALLDAIEALAADPTSVPKAAAVETAANDYDTECYVEVLAGADKWHPEPGVALHVAAGDDYLVCQTQNAADAQAIVLALTAMDSTPVSGDLIDGGDATTTYGYMVSLDGGGA